MAIEGAIVGRITDWRAKLPTMKVDGEVLPEAQSLLNYIIPPIVNRLRQRWKLAIR